MGRSLTRFSRFNIDDPNLPPAIKKAALGSGGFPYAHKMPSDEHDADLKLLQIELIKLLAWQQKTGTRLIVLFEGRDAAGKSGSIKGCPAQPQPALRPHRRAIGADRPGEGSMVFPAIRCRTAERW